MAFVDSAVTPRQPPISDELARRRAAAMAEAEAAALADKRARSVAQTNAMTPEAIAQARSQAKARAEAAAAADAARARSAAQFGAMTPEELAQAKAQAKARAEAAAAADAARMSRHASTEVPDNGSSLLRALKLGVQDVGRGAANIAGFLPDMANTVANVPIAAADWASQKLGGPELPFRFNTDTGGQIANTGGKVADVFGYGTIPWEDRTTSEKIAGNMIDLGTQAMGGSAALARRAVTRAPEIAAGATRTMSDLFTQPYLNNATRTFVGDTASGLGAGAGKSAADEYFPDNPLAAALLTLAGGVGGSTAAELAHAGARLASDVSRPLTFRTYDKNVPIDPATSLPARQTDVETAARALQTVARDPLTGAPLAPAAARSIAERTAEFRDAGLPVPTSGIISDNPGLYAAEAAARSRDGIPFINRDNQLRNAASDRVASVRDPNADQGAVTARAGDVRSQRMSPAEAAVNAAQAEADRVAQMRQAEGAPLALQRGADTRAQASQALDKAVVNDTYLPDRAHKNELYRAIDPEGTAMRDTTPLAQAVTRVRQAEAALPPSMQTQSPILRDIEGLVDPATGEARQIAFRDLETMRMKLSRAAQEARGNGSFDLADAYDAIRAEISQEGKRLAEEGGPVGERARAARENYAQNYAPRYRAGPGDEMATFTRGIDRDPTRSTTPPSETAGRFLRAPEKAAALQRVLTELAIRCRRPEGRARLPHLRLCRVGPQPRRQRQRAPRHAVAGQQCGRARPVSGPPWRIRSVGGSDAQRRERIGCRQGGAQDRRRQRQADRARHRTLGRGHPAQGRSTRCGALDLRQPQLRRFKAARRDQHRHWQRQGCPPRLEGRRRRGHHRRNHAPDQNRRRPRRAGRGVPPRAA